MLGAGPGQQQKIAATPSGDQAKIDQKIQAQIAKRCCISKYDFKKCLSGSTKENPAGNNSERWICKFCNTVICTRCV